jgi:hypothetical protein
MWYKVEYNHRLYFWQTHMILGLLKNGIINMHTYINEFEEFDFLDIRVEMIKYFIKK